MKKLEAGKVYQLHISLTGSDPLIWRRFLVKESLTLNKLHKIIQTVMGWEDYHLFEFTINETKYSMLDFDWDDDNDIEDAKGVKLFDLSLPKNSKFSYLYDFGDNWEHQIVLEDILQSDDHIKYPKCIDGELACPKEDSHGIWGHNNLKELTRTPKNELAEDDIERLDWLEDYNFEYFSTDKINYSLWKKFVK